MTAEFKTATFAGGCFWCMVQPFDTYPGIEKVVSGYTGGRVANPTYEQVCAGGTGHTEAVQITYDPSKVSYADLVEIYWQQTDPTDAFGQFQDRGDNYRPVIYYQNGEEKGKLQSKNSRTAGALTNRSSPPLNRPSPSTRPKNTTRTFTKRIPSG